MAISPAYPLTYDISDFSLGWDCINKPTTLDKRNFTDIKNFNLTRRRGLEKRGGISKLYSITAGASTDVKDLYEYKSPDEGNLLLTAISTKIRAYYDAQWNDLKTGLTSGKRCHFETHRGFCYGVNGEDDNFKLRNKTSYNVGIAPPLGAPAVAVGSPAASTLYTNHGTAEIEYSGELRQNAARTRIAQSFMLDEDYDLTKIVFKVKKIGSPTGEMIVQIHSDMLGTQVGGDSDGVEASALTSTLTSTDFDFSGTAPSLSKNTTYYIVVMSSSGTPMSAVSATDFVIVGSTWDSTYSRGRYYELDGSSAWTLYEAVDLGFEVWGMEATSGTILEFGALNTSGDRTLRLSNSWYLVAQSFQTAGDCTVLSVKLPLVDENETMMTYKMWAEIHSSTTGTSATKDASTNIVGAASDDVTSISLSSDREWVTFTFSGTAVTLTGSTTYYLVLYCDWTSAIAETDDIEVNWSRDDTGYASGQMYRVDNSLVWTGLALDMCFQLLGTMTASVKVEENALSGITQVTGLREANSQQMIVQSFKVDESADCPQVKVYMAKTGSPTGNIWAEIHSAQDGTSASADSSTHQVGTKSNNIDVTTLDAFPTFGWQTFTFAGTKPNLNAGSRYYLVIYGDYTVSTTAFANIALDKTSPGYSGGVRWDIDTSEAWTEVPTQDMIFEIWLTTAGLSGSYKYCYTYKRNKWSEMEGNPSDASDTTSPSNQDVSVGLVASTDAQVDKIILYRTLVNETTPFYKQGEYANTTATITDSTSDNGLTTLWDETNTVPPKAMFVKLHQDRVFYANCLDEDEGESLVMWSKTGNGETVPTANYQYFDKDDGEEITGVASLGTYFFVFKPNKIGVIDIGAPELWYLSYGIGCIAPWAILTLKDKIIFLSEEGWKATDGTDIWALSDSISGLGEDGYFTINEKENYSIAYYPEKEHFEFLINHSTEDPKIVVGHFLVPLILKPTGISELVKQNIMGYTYHEYDYHTLTCISTYTDDDGITRVIAGASDGFVYLLDSGTSDDGGDITARLRTDWLSLGTPRSITKVIRKGYLTYEASGTVALTLTVNVDFESDSFITSFTGGDVGVDDSINESFNLTGTGEVFRFTFLETSSELLSLMSLVIQFRVVGTR